MTSTKIKNGTIKPKDLKKPTYVQSATLNTGTPPGVGMGMKPPPFLKAGDVVTLGIQGLGEQRQTFVAFEGSHLDASRNRHRAAV